MRLRHLAVGIVFALSATPALAQSPFKHVRGTIQSFDGTTLTIRKLVGAPETVAVPATAHILYDRPAKLSDIKPGDFVASGGMTGKDGRIHAREVRIFPAAMSGLGEGQYPMAEPKSSMTNATVSAVSTSGTISANGDSGTLKMTYHGSGSTDGPGCTGHAAAGGKGCTGTTEIEVDKDVPINSVLVGDKSLLKPGAVISAIVVSGPGGNPVAPYMTVEKDGVKPPA